MSLILSGSDGVSDIDGTAATPAIRGTDTNTGIFFPAADTIAFSEGGAEVARFDSSGNLLVGNTNAATKLSVKPASDTYQLYLMQSNQTNDGWKQWAEGNNGDLLFSRSVGGSDTERFRVTAAGLLQFNSGYGSVATAYGCRAWVNFNGTGTPAIRASGNVTSITDNGTGLYTANFTTAMPDANYAAVIGANINSSNTDMRRDSRVVTWSTSNVSVVTGDSSGNSDTKEDYEFVTIAVFR